MSETTKQRNYFRIPCEVQLRFRVINDEELKVFQSYGVRPSPYSSLRQELEGQLQSMSIKEESKFLFQKAFQLLMNIDQRLERLEEQIQVMRTDDKDAGGPYDWVQSDLSAGGLSFSTEAPVSVKVGDTLLLDVLLPSFPEYRFVAAAKVLHFDQAKLVGTEFLAIHDDDREFIHSFVIQKEREILRTRAKAKETATDRTPAL